MAFFFREGDDPIVWLYLLIPSLVWPTTGINSLINTFFCQECNTKRDFHPENRLVSSHDLPLQQLVDIDVSKTGPSTAQWRPIRKLLPNERNLDADDDFMQTSSLDFEKIGGPRLEKVATFPKFEKDFGPLDYSLPGTRCEAEVSSLEFFLCLPKSTPLFLHGVLAIKIAN